MKAYDGERSRRGSTRVTLLVVVLLALLVIAPQVMARGGRTSASQGLAGLPTGHPVIGSTTDGVRLPATLASYWPRVDLADGDRRTVVGGQAMRFLGSVTSGGSSIPLTSYDLQVDGTSILSTPPKDCAATTCDSTQWIDGSWTPPTTPGDHRLVLLASAAGDSRVIRKTYTLTVQAQSAFRIDQQSVVVDPAVGWHINTLLRRVSDFTPIPNAPVSVWRSVDNAATWSKVQDGSTDASGVFDRVLFPDKSGLYKLSTPGVAGVGGAAESPPIHVEVRAKVTLTASRSTVTLPSDGSWSTKAAIATRTVNFRVSAPVGMAGNAGLLQLWSGQTWNTVAWGKIGPDGSTSVSYLLGRKRGDYKFGVVTGRNAAYAPTVSNEVHVTVR